MALSNEYTYWHLTTDGWVSGYTKTDFNKYEVPPPKGTLKTVIYTETINHKLYTESNVELVSEIDDKVLIKNTETKFPFKGSIIPYNLID